MTDDEKVLDLTTFLENRGCRRISIVYQQDTHLRWSYDWIACWFDEDNVECGYMSKDLLSIENAVLEAYQWWRLD